MYYELFSSCFDAYIWFNTIYRYIYQWQWVFLLQVNIRVATVHLRVHILSYGKSPYNHHLNPLFYQLILLWKWYRPKRLREPRSIKRGRQVECYTCTILAERRHRPSTIFTIRIKNIISPPPPKKKKKIILNYDYHIKFKVQCSCSDI